MHILRARHHLCVATGLTKVSLPAYGSAYQRYGKRPSRANDAYPQIPFDSKSHKALQRLFVGLEDLDLLAPGNGTHSWGNTGINRRAVTVCEPSSSSAGQKVRHRPVELIRALARRPMTTIFEDAQLRIRKAFVRSSRPFGRHRSVALAVH